MPSGSTSSPVAVANGGVFSYPNDDDYLLLCDVTSGDGRVNLPDPSAFGTTDTSGNWHSYIATINRVGGGSHTLLVQCSGPSGTLINGALTFALTANYQSVRIASTKTGYVVIA